MSRKLAAALFGLFTCATAVEAGGATVTAVAEPTGHAALLAGYWLLKALIVAAFTYFVAVRPASRRPARSPLALAACAAALVAAVALGAPPRSAATPLLIAGELVAVAGAVWLLCSVLALGRCFGVLPEARGLVTRGPYRLVRHPVYLGELVVFAGLVVCAPSARNLIVAAVLVAAQVVRMRLEEQALADEFPEYRDYRARTPRLVPRAALPFLGVAVVAGAIAGATGPAQAAPRPLAAPRQLAPAADAHVQAVPAFSWAKVRGAAKYEFQLAADPGFRSIVSNGGYQAVNTFASVDKTLADGNYYWRVRAIDAHERAGHWAPTRALTKAWLDQPTLLGPPSGGTVSYPRTPLVLRWSGVPNAYKYLVTIATDPSLAHSALGSFTPSVETSGTAFALPGALAPGRYYWAVTPLDSERHPGRRSVTAAFDWVWPTQTTARVADIDPEPRVFDPQFSWDPVPGAAQYQVEINPSEDFAVGSRVCCDETISGTSFSPRNLLPNNTYYWRVRAVDVDGNAGGWNAGPSFTKTFDAVTPSIPNLRVRSNTADATPPTGTSGLPTTDSPVIGWDPVPGASSYEVRVAPWQPTGYCDWTASDLTKPAAKTFLTATTAWTPLAPLSKELHPVGNAFNTVATDGLWKLWDGTSYCVRVRARSDRDARSNEIVSDWTYIGGVGHAAFTYLEGSKPACAPASTPASAYHQPQGGTWSPRMPLFTWDWVPGACGYFVVVARDPGFSKIVDVAYTLNPAYAPRTGFQPTTYTDETTSYYWVAMPTVGSDGTGLSTDVSQDNPQAFQKRSTPPQLLSPLQGSDVNVQPTFQWTPAEGAREYRIQVADDPSFGNPIDDVVTDSTSYTSSSAYPADTVLYWRVRADDENKVGLTWSAAGTFRRRLPIPTPSFDNPLGGVAIPVLSWAPVQGAVSYDMHVEQADGTKRDFNMRSTAFTPVIFYGTGVWHWQVRANFRAGFRTVSGGYSGALPFTRVIATPTGVRTSRANGGALLCWDPAPMARQYRVQIAATDSFTLPLEQGTTDNTCYAPRRMNPMLRAAPTLYWRVAVVDEGFNVGGWATSRLVSSRPMSMRVRGSLRHGRTGTVRITVTSAGRPVAGVTVTGRGAGAAPRRAKTDRQGLVKLRLRPSSRGSVSLSASKNGYVPATARLTVR